MILCFESEGPAVSLSQQVPSSQHRLFRPESVQAHQLAWLGTPTVRLTLPVSAVTIVMALLIIAAANLMTFGTYARRIDLHGLMLPKSGLIDVAAPAGGWIESIGVADGQPVDSGAVLYRVNVDTMTSNGGAQQTIVAALNAQRSTLNDQIDHRTRMGDAQGQALEDQIKNLKLQISQTNVQIATEEGFEQTLKSEYDLFSNSKSSGLVGSDQVDPRQQRWMSAKNQLEQLRTSLLGLQAQLTDAENHLATNALQTRSDIDTLKAKISYIDQQIAGSEAHRSIEIRAPGSGTVTAVIGHPGQLVAAGSPMLTIVPHHSSMQAQLLAPSSAIGFLHVGERVLLRYGAFPYQKFGQYWGTVVDVSHAALPQQEVRSLTSNSSALALGGLYRVTVQPDQQQLMIHGRAERLTPSMEVEAFVLLDARPLYQWILEPLYGLRRNFQGI
jgi:membrane fusion protein